MGKLSVSLSAIVLFVVSFFSIFFIGLWRLLNSAAADLIRSVKADKDLEALFCQFPFSQHQYFILDLTGSHFILNLERLYIFCIYYEISLSSIVVVCSGKNQCFNTYILNRYERLFNIYSCDKAYRALGSFRYRKYLLKVQKRLFQEIPDQEIIRCRLRHRLTSCEVVRGRNLLKRLGNPSGPFAVVFGRTGWYYQSLGRSDTHSVRNVDDEYVRKLRAELELQGFNVYVMGVYETIPSYKIQSSEIPVEEREFFDLYICAKAKLCVMGDSGPSILPSLFGTHCVNYNSSTTAYSNYRSIGTLSSVSLLYKDVTIFGLPLDRSYLERFCFVEPCYFLDRGLSFEIFRGNEILDHLVGFNTHNLPVQKVSRHLKRKL